jgi:hypothetical protein
VKTQPVRSRPERERHNIEVVAVLVEDTQQGISRSYSCGRHRSLPQDVCLIGFVSDGIMAINPIRDAALMQEAEWRAPTYAGAHYALSTTLRKLGRDDAARRHLAAYQTSPKSNQANDDPLFQQVIEFDQQPDTLLRRGTALEQQDA